MSDYITLNHGSGGRLTGELIKNIFAVRFDMKEPFTDSALLEKEDREMAFTTDSYVIDPIFFPGGNIGKLSVCGTVNDLAVAGAVPLYMSASFIIEEGFPVKDLVTIVDSMEQEARYSGVKIIAGDTKVVEKGKCDKIFITTTGAGIMREGCRHIGTAENVRQGDKLITNGSVGNHSVAVMSARERLSFISQVESDCASLNHLIGKVLDVAGEVHFMRDLTRGGLATVLNELATMTGLGIEVYEQNIPVDEPVRGLCEMMGFDPLYLANEGKVLIVVSADECQKVIEVLRSDTLGRKAEIIGEVTGDFRKLVVMRTVTGGKRILDMHSGTQLPRIC
ncbi:MAG: hydrogenase expression/formation protein HypE [Bacteroidales bacterium]